MNKTRLNSKNHLVNKGIFNDFILKNFTVKKWFVSQLKTNQQKENTQVNSAAGSARMILSRIEAWYSNNDRRMVFVDKKWQQSFYPSFLEIDE